MKIKQNEKIIENKLPAFSFRRKEWAKLETRRKTAKQRLVEGLPIPDIGNSKN